MNQKMGDQELERAFRLTQDAVVYLDEVNELTAALLTGDHAGLDGPNTFLLAHCVRMLRLAQAINLLVRNSHIDPSAAILRILLEQGYVLSAIDEDPQNLEILFDEDGAEGAKALKGLRHKMTVNERHIDLTDDKLDAAIASLPKGSGFAAHNWAGRAKLDGSYWTLYRRLSNFSHGGAGGSAEYFHINNQGIPMVRTRVAPQLAPDFLIVAAALILGVISSFALRFSTKEQKVEYARLQETFISLSRSIASFMENVRAGRAVL